MKFIRFLMLCVFVCSCASKSGKELCQTYPPYKLINSFSQKINPETGLVLCGYGINFGLPRDYQIKNGIGNFAANYKLKKSKNDEIFLDNARKLIVFIAENFLREINSNQEIRDKLDAYPFASNALDIMIHFKDENEIDLGQGVAIIYFSNNKIKYKGYNIKKYTGHFPAEGKHFTIHEESYTEALDIVKKNGPISYL